MNRPTDPPVPRRIERQHEIIDKTKPSRHSSHRHERRCPTHHCCYRIAYRRGSCRHRRSRRPTHRHSRCYHPHYHCRRRAHWSRFPPSHLGLFCCCAVFLNDIISGPFRGFVSKHKHEASLIGNESGLGGGDALIVPFQW
ncbi:hypothetical protein B0H12DRAFT_548176 [Mycena haematopus]|nr:hypothetical protein B0H12DRAFT_548176 [Mycena haematopus]